MHKTDFSTMRSVWICGLMLIFACMGRLHAADGGAPADVLGEEAIVDRLNQLMETWPGQSAAPAKATSGSSFPTYEDIHYIQAFRSLDGPVPMEFNPHVKKFILLFTAAKRQEFGSMLSLSEYYFPKFEAELRRRGMPAELKYLPLVLSALNPRSVGNDGSAGIWRLHYHTALRYGLQCNRQYDERRDVDKATDAALEYLQLLHKQFGTWDRAIAAYVCGPAGLKKAITRSGGSRDFWQIYEFLPGGAREILPAYYAAAYTCMHREDHELTAGKCPLPMEAEPLKITKQVAFSALSRFSKVSETKLRDLNPLYRDALIPAGTHVAFPLGTAAMVAGLLDTIYASSQPAQPKAVTLPGVLSNEKGETPVVKASTLKTPPPKPVIPENSALVEYTIRSGDVLGAIAEKFEVRVSELQQWNHIRGHYIRAGDELKVYVPKQDLAKYQKISNFSSGQQGASAEKSTSVSPVAPTSPKKIAGTGQYVYYTVKSGDNLWAIAKKYPGVSDQDIMEFNGMESTRIDIGQKLKIPKK